MKELTPQRKKMFAYLIRKGLATTRVRETRRIFFTGLDTDNFGQTNYGACAWGLVFVGLFHNADEAHDFKVTATKPFDGGWDTIRRELEVPEKYFDKISRLHKDNDYSAAALADAFERNLI